MGYSERKNGEGAGIENYADTDSRFITRCFPMLSRLNRWEMWYQNKRLDKTPMQVSEQWEHQWPSNWNKMFDVLCPATGAKSPLVLDDMAFYLHVSPCTSSLHQVTRHSFIFCCRCCRDTVPPCKAQPAHMRRWQKGAYPSLLGRSVNAKPPGAKYVNSFGTKHLQQVWERP